MFPLLALVILAIPFLLIAAIGYAILHRKKVGEDAILLPENFYGILGAAVLGFNIFAYEAAHGIGWGIFVMLLLVGLAFSFSKEQRTPVVWAIALIGSAAALLFGWRDNAFVQNINILTAALCMLALFVMRTIDGPVWKVLWLARAAFFVVVRALVHVVSFVGAAFNVHRSRHPMLISIIKTVAVTLVVLTIFLVILSQADPVFELAVRTLREQMIGRTILTLLLTLGLAFSLSIPAEKDTSPAPRFTILGLWEVAIPAGSLILLLGFFLSIQQRYLFGDHADFQGLGLTYAEYVRKGFIELIIAALVGGVISYAIALKKETLEGTQRRALTALNTLLLLALALLLFSALKRDWMYMDMYGLTRVRIIGEVFLAWVAGMLALIALYTLIHRLRESVVLGGVIMLSAGVVLYLNAINMDMRIASAAPPRNEPIDMVYLSMLSADAIDGWETVITESGKTYETLRTNSAFSPAQRQRLADSFLALQFLRDALENLTFEMSDRYTGMPVANWQEWNAARIAAIKRVRANQPLFQEKITCLMQEMGDLQIERGLDLTVEEQHRLWDYQYPFMERSYMVYPMSIDELSAQRRDASGMLPGVVAESCE